jgi:hypothetical protein
MPFPTPDPTRPPRPLPVRPVNVTYEFHNDPPITVRLAVPARSQQQAIIKAMRLAKSRPEFKGRQPSSVLVLAFRE